MSVQLHDYEAIKLDILYSLARSQRALASMLEHITEMGSLTDTASDELARELVSMSAYQQSLANHLLQIKLRTIKYGSPTSPWLNKTIFE